MHQRKIIEIIAVSIWLIVAAVITWIRISLLFIDEIVEEPISVPTSWELVGMSLEKWRDTQRRYGGSLQDAAEGID
jgi:hypothetical protein